MMGIGIGIDYALLMVTRFREWRAAGLDPEAATVATLDTAGRCGDRRRQHRRHQHARPVRDGPVVHARRRARHHPRRARRDGRQRHAVPGAARLPRPARRPAAAAARPPPPAARRDRRARRAERAGWPGAGSSSGTAVPAAIVGVASCSPSPRRSSASASASPTPATTARARPTRTAYDLLADGFGPGANGPLLIVAELPSGAGDVGARRSHGALRDDPGVAAVTPAALNPAGDTAVVPWCPTTGPQAPRTEDLVHRLRDTTSPPRQRAPGSTCTSAA